MKGRYSFERLDKTRPRVHEWIADRHILSCGPSKCFERMRTLEPTTKLSLLLSFVYIPHRTSIMSHSFNSIMFAYPSHGYTNSGMVGSPTFGRLSTSDDVNRRYHAGPSHRAIFTATPPPGLSRTASMAGSIFSGSDTCPVSTCPEIQTLIYLTLTCSTRHPICIILPVPIPLYSSGQALRDSPVQQQLPHTFPLLDTPITQSTRAHSTHTAGPNGILRSTQGTRAAATYFLEIRPARPNSVELPHLQLAVSKLRTPINTPINQRGNEPHGKRCSCGNPAAQ